ncbi:hypothetical protein KI387_005450, partial [Taxus chinensis]
MNNITCSCPEVILEAKLEEIQAIDNLEELVNLLLIRSNREREKMIEELVMENQGKIDKRVKDYEEIGMEIKELTYK